MIDIVSKRYWFFAVSLLVILPGLYSLATAGLKLSIAFTSGSLLELRVNSVTNQTLAVADVRRIAGERISSDAVIQIGGADTIIIRSKPMKQDDKVALVVDLEAMYGKTTELSFETVGAEVSQEVTGAAVNAVILASLAILAWITVAFYRVPKPYRYGVAAIIAMLHDVAVVIGMASILGQLFNFEIDALFLTALLTVIGFSVHDTIVVFDRIRENVVRHRGMAYESIVNHSIVQTLDRSINTTLTVLLTLFALWLFGGITIRNFVLTLLLGIFSGSYSSIFNAAQILVAWESGEVGRFFRRLRGQATA
ncbi:MAG: protein translocase subunit SecF [Chloroflexi bacterium]|nr:protein translocase subunit SecF [Chloroflexota bacterium]